MPAAQAPEGSRLTTRVVKGSIWTLAGQMAPLGVSLITTPIVIRLLGAESYGVLVLFVIIPQYLYFADFGMSLASTKFGSAAFAAGDRTKEAGVIRLAALISLLASIPVAALLAIFAAQAAQLFNVPERLLAETTMGIRFVAATLPLTLLGIIFNSPLLARLRMDLHTLVAAGSRILGMIAIPIAIYLGFGLVGAAVVLFAAAALNVVGQLALSAFLLPEMLGLSLDRRSLPQLMRFGASMCIAAVAAMALVNLEKGGLSALSSVTQLAYYSVAFSLAAVLTFASGAMQQSLIPVFSQLQGAEHEAERNLIFSRAIRMMLLAMLPFVGLAGIIAETGITLFAGEEFGRESTLPFYVLLSGITFMIATYTPSAAIIASGRTELFARLYWLELPPYALLVWILVSRYGAVGAAAAWSTRAAVDSILQFQIAQRFSGVHFDLQRSSSALVAGAIAAVPFVLYLVFGLGLFGGLLASAVGMAVYAVFVWRFALLAEEKAWFIERSRAFPGF